MGEKPKVGISACLLGRKTRFDDACSLDPYLRDTLGRYVEWVSVCPEVECGFPVPREPMRLKGDPANPRLFTVSTGVDCTERMRRWTEKKLRAMEGDAPCGFVFKSGSPCCGLRGVKVSALKTGPMRRGAGVFARAFMRRFPLLPAADEKGMTDRSIRESFIERVFASMRWKNLITSAATLNGLREFHLAHELLLRVHHPDTADSLTRLISRAGAMTRQKLFEGYGARFMSALRREATVAKNAKVLNIGFNRLKERLSAEEAEPLKGVIQDFRDGQVPLLVPLVLLRHYVERFADPYLSRQIFLDPYPVELGLRASV
jgi:uncharacterized protein YbgA (DUF1722 family)/uncharacterized protein YbbK (DUF523 family)